MGLFFRPRRPLMRVAAGAATAGIAYNAGKRRARQDEYNQEAASAYQSAQAPPPQAPPQPSVPQQAPSPQAQATADPTMSELSRLAELHQSGQLSDAEYTAAKAKLLGL